jgi:hypothetical protein
MKRPVLITSLALAGALLVGCTAVAETSAGGDSGAASAQLSAVSTAFTGDLSPDEVLAANADYTTVNTDEWSEAEAVDIALSGSSATVSGSGSSAVTVDGSTVTIAEAGVYRLSGELEGQVVVAAPDDALVVLILDGADISSSTGAAARTPSPTPPRTPMTPRRTPRSTLRPISRSAARDPSSCRATATTASPARTTS